MAEGSGERTGQARLMDKNKDRRKVFQKVCGDDRKAIGKLLVKSEKAAKSIQDLGRKVKSNQMESNPKRDEKIPKTKSLPRHIMPWAKKAFVVLGSTGNSWCVK